MYSIFDVPWENLELEHVAAFLREAGAEGLVWEAKADDPRPETPEPKPLHPHKIRNGLCGLANQVGGYFLVGARQAHGAWELPGIARPSPEMDQWLAQITRNLQPRPRCEWKHWELDTGRVAAVIRVEPITQTPCMTNDGQVFERVDGDTLKVKSPERLSELILRGREARDKAENGACLAATELLEYPDAQRDRSVWISVGLRAASYEPDINSRLFHERFHKALYRGFGDRLCKQAGLSAPTHPAAVVRQSFLALGGQTPGHFWVASAHWSGRVGVMAGLAGDTIRHQAMFPSFIVPAWSLAADLVNQLGGYGDARMHLTIRVQTTEDSQQPPINLGTRPGLPPPPSTLYGRLPRDTNIRRHTEIRPPTADELGSVQREIERAAGYFSFEGEPDPPDEADET